MNGNYLLLTRGRTAVSVLTQLLAVPVFDRGYEIFGLSQALITPILLTFAPIVLAHGALVTADIGADCLFVFGRAQHACLYSEVL